MNIRSYLWLFVASLSVLTTPSDARAQTGVLTVLHSFTDTGTTDPNAPYGPIAVGDDGNLYGVTYAGGANGKGQVFQLASGGGAITAIYDFGGQTNDAAAPEAGLINGGDGYLYGTSDVGGSQNLGTAYKVSPTGAYLTLHSFTLADSPVLTAPLFKGSDGYFYGTTVGGGHDYGSAFRLDSTGSTVDFLYQFSADYYVTTTGALVEASNGYFYGVAIKGDGSSAGVVYRVKSGADPVVPLATLDPSTMGSYPVGGLADGGDGFLYGATYYGGTNGGGTLYRVSYDGSVIENFYVFGNNNDAYEPETPLIRASDGNFYGASENNVYQITPAGVLTVLATFDSATSGQGPEGALFEDPDSPLTFYGVNNRSGTGGYGTIYKVVVTPRPPAPVVTSATTAAGQPGVTFSYQITATNSPTGYDAAPLPRGLTVDATSGVISGTPALAGTTGITISATNAGGTGTATLTLVVATSSASAPMITSAATAPATVGTAFSYQIVATNSPTSYTATGLPDGLTLDPTSGLISGTPTASGTFSVALGATNASGTGPATLTLTVSPASTSSQLTVAITSPPNGITLVAGSNLPLAASVSDPTQVSQVQFLVNGAVVGATAAAGPYVVNATAPTASGIYMLAAVVTDLQGRQSTGSVTVTIIAADPANPPPVTDLLTPLDGRNLLAGTTLTLTANASSSGATLTEINFYADNTLIVSLGADGSPIPSPGLRRNLAVRADAITPTPVEGIFQTVYTLPATDKLVNLLVVAFDALGQATVASVQTVHSTLITDQSPVVTLSGVSNGEHINVGSTAAVTVNASDPDAANLAQSRTAPVRLDAGSNGALSKLENFVNKALISLLTAPPYDYSFSPPSAGKYVLHSVATDGSGLATVSDPIVVEADAVATTTPTVTIAVVGDGMAVEGGENGKVAIRRDGDLTNPLVVRYKVVGGVVAGVDYKALPGVATIPAGSAQVKVKIKPIDNTTVDGTRIAKVKLKAATDGSYTLGSPTAAKVHIIDND